MTTIFYLLFLLIGLIEEMSAIVNPARRLELKSTLKNFDKQRKEGLDPNLPDGIGWQFSYLILTFIGLLSSQWLLFLILIMFSIIIPKKWKFIIVIDAVIGLIVVISIVINKFHIHYDFTEYIKSFF